MRTAASARSRVAWALLPLMGALLAAACTGARARVEVLAPGGSLITTVWAEVAQTPDARQVGLMYRTHLASDAGMIFVFPASHHLTFWMKNTEIPLDMIFAAPDHRVTGIVSDAQPFTTTIRSVPGDAQYVLEVNGGFCKRHGIVAGDRLRFDGFYPEPR